VVYAQNPFFIQIRPGKDEKLFKIIKFKTMIDSKFKNGKKLSDRERMTKIGRLIRALSLDELPQIINILNGDMSLIGPRPLFVEYLPLYNEKQRKRHSVRPGITGWSQVNGRNSVSWKARFEQDVWYVDNLSFCLDFKIFILTILKIINREGINTDKDTTMSIWKGNNEDCGEQ